MANQYGNFQARPRMRVPTALLPSLHQFHVIRAITRHPKIDEEGLYGQTLAEFTHGNNAEAFYAFGEFVYKVTSGTLPDDKNDAPVQPLLNIGLRDVDEHTCSKIREFNLRYLNDTDISALLTLLAFDAAGLDLAAIDIFRGRPGPDENSQEAPVASYTPEQCRMVHEGLRILARVAIRSYMRNQGAVSTSPEAPDGGEEEE